MKFKTYSCELISCSTKTLLIEHTLVPQEILSCILCLIFYLFNFVLWNVLNVYYGCSHAKLYVGNVYSKNIVANPLCYLAIFHA